MTTENLQYRAIVDTCRKSQEILDKRLVELALQKASGRSDPDDLWAWHFNRTGRAARESPAEYAFTKALAESELYEPMWHRVLRRRVDLSRADFTGLLFSHARFEHARFLECDFSGSRWIFSSIKDSNCAGSDFSGMWAILNPFRDTDCTKCDFSNAVIHFYDPFEKNNCAGARFVGATLETSESFFNAEKLASRTKFDGAVMDGCRLTIKKEERPEHRRPRKEVESVLQSLFSPEQMAVMKIDYGSSACFIATAACGIDSSEVAVLRRFRDTALLNSALGRRLAGAYYRLSPPLASFIESSPRMRSVVRNVLVRPIREAGGQEEPDGGLGR